MSNEDRLYWGLASLFILFAGTGGWFLLDFLGKKAKLIVSALLTAIGLIGLYVITFTIPRVGLYAPSSLILLATGLLIYDIYITRAVRRAPPSDPKSAAPTVHVSRDERIIITQEFRKLAPEWLQQLVLYKALGQAYLNVNGLVNEFERWGISGAKERIVEPIINNETFIRRLPDERISIRDDATRQVLRELFQEEPLLRSL